MGSLFGFSGSPDPALLDRMDQALRHRGGSQLFHDQTNTGTLACRPLDGKTSPLFGAQGLYSEGTATLALAGYLTNWETLGQPLLPRLMQLYRAEGPGFVRGLKGAFVLALRDGETLYLARDGAGVRTLYYGLAGGRLLFAVEPKGVRADPAFPRRIRPGAVAQYLTFSFIPGKGTMLEDLEEIPAGHLVTVNGRERPRLECYFPFENLRKENSLPDTRWIARFRDSFAEAVRQRLPENEPVGLFLSGGIDSSVVGAELARQYDGPTKAYAIHFGPSMPHELDFARAVADRVGLELEPVLIRPKDFLPRLRKIIWHLDDPIGDPITVPNFELSAHASKEVGWIFNGEGGDPVFGGPKNIPMLLHHWYGGIERDDAFREREYLASYRRCYDDLEYLLTPEWQALYDPRQDLENLLTPFFTTTRPDLFLDKLQAINIRLKGAHLILPKVDRMTGAWGLVPMAPLFDENLIELSFRMPNRLKLDKGIEKVVLKRAYQQDLPREVIDRPKSGMRVPVHFWFQKELKRYAQKILSPKRIREVGIFNEKRVRQLLKYDIEEGRGRYGLRLWMLITFEIWRRIVIEGEAP